MANLIALGARVLEELAVLALVCLTATRSTDADAEDLLTRLLAARSVGSLGWWFVITFALAAALAFSTALAVGTSRFRRQLGQLILVDLDLAGRRSAIGGVMTETSALVACDGQGWQGDWGLQDLLGRRRFVCRETAASCDDVVCIAEDVGDGKSMRKVTTLSTTLNV